MSRTFALLSNATATGSAHRWPGGRGTFEVDGSFDGATVTLQKLGPDGTNYLSLGTDAALTAEGVINFDLPPCHIRALVAGGSPNGMYATATKIGEV